MDSRRQGNKCCVANCNDWSSKRHRFPKNEPEIFNMWLMSVNPPNYKSLSVQEIYTKFFVCDRHFSPDCIVPGTKRGLKKTAVPTLHIPGLSATQISPQIIPSQVRQETEPTRIVIQPEDEAGPSYIRSHSPIPTLTGITATLKITHDPSSNVSRDIQPEEENPLDIRSRTPLPTFTGIIDVPETPKARSSHFSRGSRKRRMILNNVDVTRAADLTPKARKLYKTVCEWNTKMNRIQRRVTSFQDRLALPEKADNSREFKKLMNYVNESTYNFILCQVRNQQLHPKGRRYTLDEKILALSLLKASGRGYKILSKIFSLPSKKTLTNLLNKIPFKPGVNKYMFKNLQKTVEKMSEQDRCCIIMFDELSIDCGVNYNIKEDCITGLDDNGHKKKTELADHANVFMLRGLYKQWKQPISYTFSSGPIKSTILKQMIVEIVTECQNIGLSIIATVCDQGSANQAAINGLLQNAREKHVKTLTESNILVSSYKIKK